MIGGRIRNRLRNFLKIKQDPDPDPKLLGKSEPDPDKKNSFGSATLIQSPSCCWRRSHKSRVVDPDLDSVTWWIRIRIGNPDPGSRSRGKKIEKFQWIELKCWIRIRIESTRIHNPEQKAMQLRLHWFCSRA
jgi:hypothetical protein